MIRIGLWIAIVVLALDQLSKWWLLKSVLNGPEGFLPLTGFLNLVRVWNQGISFGIFGGDGAPAPMLLAFFSFTVAFLLMIWLGRTGRRWTGWGVGCIVGGALGNGVDRLRYGAVFDFLDLHLFDVHWPAFNLADAAISLGVGMILIDALLERRELPK